MPRPDPLAPYHAKRDFAATPEPTGRPESRSEPQGLQFVVQRHAARRLHYDFRLEWGGTLKSWAVPKGPSLDPDIQRLAVQVEDHPLEYADFEGTIPPGHYGAGEVAVCDRGIWIPRGDVDEGLRRGKLQFELRGTRLHGEWTLYRLAHEPTQWMLRKRRDRHARPGDGDAVLHEEPTPLPAGPPAPTPPTRARNGRWAAGAAPPQIIEPQLATLVDRPPAGNRWVYEIKYDGYRMLARLEGEHVRLFSRNGLEWTDRLSALVRTLSVLRLGSGWLDGEIVVMDAQGRTDFHALQAALDRDASQVEYVVFDVPGWGGRDLREEPLHARLEVLDRVFEQLPPGVPLARSRPLAPQYVGQAVLQAACRMGLEGMIGKHLDAPYRAGRSPHWIKLKCRGEQEVVVGGYTEPRGSRGHLGALLVGIHDEEGKLRYAGRVGSGFDERTLAQMWQRLQPLRAPRCPFAPRPTLPRATTVHWVRPELVVQVRFATWTHEGLLRQASFVGVREDKPAKEVRREVAEPRSVPDDPASGPTVSPSAVAGTAPRASAKERRADVRGIPVSNPHRLVYSVPRVTKLEVVRYHEAIGEHLLPHLLGRPLSLVRCPQGTGGDCFFQKHVQTQLPEGVVAVEVPSSEGPDTQVAVTSIEGVIALAQYGNVEFHTWGARMPRPDRPDRLTMDLDPDPELPWSSVVEAAQLTRVLLEELGLVAFLKTTGGKGLHIVTPIRTTRGWDEVKAFAKALASRLATVAPQRFTARLTKTRREGRIFVDYLRNGRGATAVAAYSLRARPGAPVPMPLAWDALDPREDLRGEHFNIRNALAHAPGADAAWAAYEESRRTLTVKMMRALGLDA